MKKKIGIIVLSLIILIFICFSNYNLTFAVQGIYDPITGNNPLYGPAEIIVGAIKWAGVAFLIGALIVKGIRFMMVAPEEKAKIKKELTMIAIGAVILFSFMSLIDMIYTASQNSF